MRELLFLGYTVLSSYVIVRHLLVIAPPIQYKTVKVTKNRKSQTRLENRLKQHLIYNKKNMKRGRRFI